MIEFGTNPEIESLRAEYAKANDSARALEQKLKDGKTRAPELARELAVAIANDDTQRVNELRAERVQLEQDARDLTAAAEIAQRRVETADAKLARAEWPLIAAALNDAVACFNGVTADADALSSALREAIPRAGSRWSVAFRDEGDPLTREDRPLRMVPAGFRSISTLVYRAIGSVN
jgi:chromosome segregation ATPase